MPASPHRRTVSCKLIFSLTLAALCGLSWSANAVQRRSHAHLVEAALSKVKQAGKAKVDLASAHVKARSIRVASLSAEPTVPSTQASAPDTIKDSGPRQSANESEPPQASTAANGGAPSQVLDSDFAEAIDSRTAVYDISARTVYLPDGTKLEAHSGLGKFMDDPRSVKEKNRGVTPPNVYDLTLREQPFHGVKALRLIPTFDNAMYGRDGILAHRYMLGPSGQSNGCVVFKDYPAFLQAFLSGQVNRLLVVASMAVATPVNTRVAGG